MVLRHDSDIFDVAMWYAYREPFWQWIQMRPIPEEMPEDDVSGIEAGMYRGHPPVRLRNNKTRSRKRRAACQPLGT
jgi:hypothetical protein